MSDLLRGFRLGKMDEEAQKFTSSVSYDSEILEQVIKVNMAHMAMLIAKGIVDKEKGLKCIDALKGLKEIELDYRLEDVHMVVEDRLISEVGEEAGGLLNLAKSRNDQVSTAIRMRLKEYILDLMKELIGLRKVLLGRAEQHLGTIMPGYTHMQQAQPISLSTHLLAYFFSLGRDVKRLIHSYTLADECPMGSAALATTSVKVDRNLVAKLLGFSKVMENPIDAVSSRGFVLDVIFSMTCVMLDLSRMAEELIVWGSKEFGFVEMSDELSSTSSIMPQKRNPVVCEVVRAKASNLIGELAASASMLKALPYSYNLDLQELTPHLWSSCRDTLDSVRIMEKVMSSVRSNAERMRSALDESTLATSLADELVQKQGLSFRKAHNIVGMVAREAEGKSFIKTAKTMLPKLLGTELPWLDSLTPESVVESRRVFGGTSRASTLELLKVGKDELKREEAWLLNRLKSLKDADAKLESFILGLRR